MVDQEMLEALRQLIRAETSSIVDQKMADQEQRLINGMKLLIENQVTAQINALAEGHKEIVENLADVKRQLAANKDLQDEMSVVKAAIKTHTAQIKANTTEIDKLKKAQ